MENLHDLLVSSTAALNELGIRLSDVIHGIAEGKFKTPILCSMSVDGYLLGVKKSPSGNSELVTRYGGPDDYGSVLPQWLDARILIGVVDGILEGLEPWEVEVPEKGVMCYPVLLFSQECQYNLSPVLVVVNAVHMFSTEAKRVRYVEEWIAEHVRLGHERSGDDMRFFVGADLFDWETWLECPVSGEMDSVYSNERVVKRY